GLHVPNRAVLFQRDGHRAFFVGKRPAVWMVELPGHAPHIADFRLAPRERNAGLVEKGDVAVRIGRVDGRRQRFQQIAKLLFTGGVVRRVPRWSGMLGKNRVDIRTPKQIQHPSFPDLNQDQAGNAPSCSSFLRASSGSPVSERYAPLPLQTKRPPTRGGRIVVNWSRHCFFIVSSLPAFFSDFFDFFICFLLILPGAALVVSVLVAAPLSCAKAIDGTRAVEETKARAVVAMISLRMQNPPCV